jgi:geranylgeranyl pyrophosphate synthase
VSPPFTTERLFDDVTRFLDSQNVPGTLQALQRAVLSKARRKFEHEGRFSILDFPLAIQRALGGPDEVGGAIAGAALLFYASADVIDDAVDHDLASDPWTRWGWEQATNTGLSLLFLSLTYLQDTLGAVRAAPALTVFVHAGHSMAAGQHLDLIGQDLEQATIADYTAFVERKTGASFAAYAEAIALLCGREPAESARCGEFGEALGSMLQMISDNYELWNPTLSSDYVNRRLSFPLVLALEQAQGEARARLLELLSGDRTYDRQRELVALLESLGTRGYATLRIEVYRKRASDLARSLGLSEEPYLRQLLEFPAFPPAAPAL